MGQYLYIGLCYKVRIRRGLLADHMVAESELLQGMTNLLNKLSLTENKPFTRSLRKETTVAQ